MAFKQVSLALAALWLSSVAGEVRAQTPSSVLAVTYLEAPATKVQTLIGHLRAHPAGAAPAPLILHELGRPNRILVVEHLSAPDGSILDPGFLSEIAADLQAPRDRRLNDPIVSNFKASPAKDAFHVVMHLDAVPVNADAALALIRAQEAPVLAAPGGIGFELGVQSDHHNHFTIHEVWASRQAYEAYTAGPAAMTLRKDLAPIEGAPFDDRFYAEVP